MSLCIDLVLNHCAAEHEWAGPRPGRRPRLRGLLLDLPRPPRCRTAYERTLPGGLPRLRARQLHPARRTGAGCGRRSTRFQWDLNWSNPRVFVEITDILLELANRGVDVFRLDAVAFMWKRLGTNCQNQPEVHGLLRALRACARIAAPAVIFKAEAIVGPDDLAPYLGVGRNHGRECDLAYHNSLMVQYWSALATRDTRLMTHVLSAFPTKPATTSWATYIRCHDDIGWAITEADAEAVGWTGPEHRAFLSVVLRGRRSPAASRSGRSSSTTRPPATRRISGSFASLAGLERALADGEPGAGGSRRGPDPPRPRPDHGLGRAAAALHGRRDRDSSTTGATATSPAGPPTAGGSIGPAWTGRGRRERHGDGPVGRVFRGTRHLVRVRAHAAGAARGDRRSRSSTSATPALFAFVAGAPVGPAARRPQPGRDARRRRGPGARDDRARGCPGRDLRGRALRGGAAHPAAALRRALAGGCGGLVTRREAPAGSRGRPARRARANR